MIGSIKWLSSHHRSLGAYFTIALAAAALVPAGAQAARPDDRAGRLGVGGTSQAAALASSPRPDDRPGRLGVGAALVTSAEATRDAFARPSRPRLPLRLAQTIVAARACSPRRLPRQLVQSSRQPRRPGETTLCSEPPACWRSSS